MPPWQTQASQEVLLSKNFWRLKKRIESSGDIFEIDTSLIALYVGPESDVADLQVTYYDKNVPGELQQAVISPGAPFIGRLDAQLDTTVVATGQRARILVSPADIVNPAYLRPQLLQPFRTIRVPPFIDLVGVFGDLIQVPMQRSDRQFRTAAVAVGTDAGTGFADSVDVQFPIANRRCYTVSATRLAGFGTRAVDVEVSGVVLTPAGFSIPVILADFTLPVIAGVPTSQTISFLACDPQAVDTTVSPPVRIAAGNFDILIVNLEPAAGVGIPRVDLVIHASDRT
jgi:hypothetical protein